MYMHAALKAENVELKAHMKNMSSNLDKLESRVGRQENDVKKLRGKK
jgi:cell division protein FtsB